MVVGQQDFARGAAGLGADHAALFEDLHDPGGVVLAGAPEPRNVTSGKAAVVPDGSAGQLGAKRRPHLTALFSSTSPALKRQAQTVTAPVRPNE
jgi:hypothetical protein